MVSTHTCRSKDFAAVHIHILLLTWGASGVGGGVFRGKIEINGAYSSNLADTNFSYTLSR